LAEWHPIQNARPVEWVLSNGTFEEPYGVIRELRFGQGKHRERWFRLVTWAANSAGRKLVGYHHDPRVLAELAWERMLEQNRRRERGAVTVDRLQA